MASDEGPEPRFATPRRLHPASILVGIDLGRLLQAGFIPLLALIGEGGRVALWILAAVVVGGFAARVLDWGRRTYAFDGAELRVESGIVGRSLRTLDVARIQQIEIRRGFLQRLLGLSVVRVETAGSASEPEVELRVIAHADATDLRSAVRAAKSALARPDAALDPSGPTRAPGVDAVAPEPILTVPARHVVLASVTGVRLLVLPAVLAAAAQLAGDISDRFWDWLARRLDLVGETAAPLLADGGAAGTAWVVGIALVSGATLVAATAAAVTGLLRDGDFRVDRVEGDLHVSRGLLSTRESLVPLKRVQLVAIRSNWLRRMLGFATVEIRSAGGSAGRGGSVTIPLLPISDVERFLGEILPDMPELPPLVAHPRSALRRTLVRRVTRAALLAVVIGAGLSWGGWLTPRSAVPLVALVGLGAVRGIAEFRALGHAVTDAIVVSRHGGLSLTTSVGPLNKVQGVERRAGPFQRRLNLASLDVHVAGPLARLTIRDAGSERLTELRTALTRRAARAD